MNSNIRRACTAWNELERGAGGQRFSLTAGGDGARKTLPHISVPSLCLWIWFDANGAPEMDVTGNTVSIADGDAAPSSADDTDFGSADITLAAWIASSRLRISAPRI
ncbi:MAG: hypothetical protein L0Z50_21035 [Verrucomicrobiales bacterium]|nr:hypothetical protein [Verrucomicrobiales bacterium]